MIGEILVNEGMAHKEVVDAAIEKQKSARDTKAKQSKTIRVDAEKLDYLINMVGELVISIANLGQHAKRVNDSGLQESTSIMSRLVEEIRDAAMKVRMVPIGETFSRFQRVIRDISKEMGKDIDLIISGGETEI
jgi:two-component system chemotaxis sensor kinase CheA